MKKKFAGILIYFCLAQPAMALPKDFVFLKDAAPNVPQKMMYFSFENFVGEKIRGYNEPTCILTKKAAQAIEAVQRDIEKDGLSLLVFDCYRPQRAVDHFIAFSKDSESKTKADYYPNLTKARMFAEGYVATKSGHSRGSTVDLTVIPRHSKDVYYQGCQPKSTYQPTIDFGTGIDCMDPKSNTLNPEIQGQSRINRHYLVEKMKKYGFKNLAEEWWHYTLIDEPFPDTYFDFPVETSASKVP